VVKDTWNLRLPNLRHKTQMLVQSSIFFLEDPRILVMSNENFNVLAWWKNNSNAYPVLSLMARDILAIPVSTHTCPQNLHLVLLEEFFVKIGLHTPQKTLKP